MGAKVFCLNIPGGTVVSVFTYMTSQCDTLQPLAPRLLYDRRKSARQLSISIRSLDYLIAAKTFQVRRIGSKVLIPHSELVRYSRGDHFGPIKGNDAE